MNSTPADRLHEAMADYRRCFGHDVPANVATMYATQPGPLLNEIRQAVALGKPVPAWGIHAKRAAAPERWIEVA